MHVRGEEAAEPRAAHLRDLMSHLRPHRSVLVAVVAVSLVGAAVSLAQPVAVNRAITAVSAGEPFAQDVWLLVGLVVLAGLLGAVGQFLLERTAEGVVLGARRRLVTHLLRLPVREYDTRRTGDLVSRVGSDTTLLRGALTGGLVDALGSSIVLVGSVVAMALLDPLLLGITILVVTIAVVAVVVASARIQALTRRAQDAVGRVAAGTERALSAVRTVRAAGATERETDKVVADAEAAYGYGVRIARVGAVLWPVTALAVQGSFLAVLGVGGYRVATGATSVADLVTFILFLFMMVVPLGQLFAAVTTVRGGLGALARVQEILDLPTEDEDPRPEAGVLAEPALPQDGRQPPALELDRVGFAYAPHRPVVDDVSLTVPRGSITAIVGPSGGGKTTLLALIERFYEVDSGAIRMHGNDIRGMPRAELRAGIGYVEQDAPVLAGTIRDNLVLAAPDADEARCRIVLESVNLLTRVLQHPDGLDAVVGDDGAGLSGGERQRLAIARALLAEAPVLLLDEPTAALDARNEQAMQAALRSAAHGRTVLIVAHRLATVVHADQIAVIDGGRVLAVGTHDELLVSCDLYRELAQHQLLA